MAVKRGQHAKTTPRSPDAVQLEMPRGWSGVHQDKTKVSS